MASSLSAGAAEFVPGRLAMFEDSTFESACRIHTRSREWMIAAFTFNASILLAFVMIPLIFPPALPRHFTNFLMEVLVPQQQQQPRPIVPTARPSIETPYDPFQAPRRIPTGILIPAVPEPPLNPNSDNWASNSEEPNSALFRSNTAAPVVRPAVNTRLRVSSGTEEGLIIEKRMPVYPAIAKATGVSGTVTLTAIISKTGTIENLRVTGGPAMLRQAALDAVSTWRYRPYLLDGQPVEVETTVSVIFTLER
jgi:protein TonB